MSFKLFESFKDKQLKSFGFKTLKIFFSILIALGLMLQVYFQHTNIPSIVQEVRVI